MPKRIDNRSLLFAGPILLSVGCQDRVCSDPGVCWANKDDIAQAAERCGIPDFEPQEPDVGYGPWVPGEDPDTGPKTRCIIDDLSSQGLQVTH